MATGLTPDAKIEHREKQLQWQLFNMEHARKGYPLKEQTMASCMELAKQAFGTARVAVPFSMRFTPDKMSQYIICEGIVAMLPPSTTGRNFESFTAPDGRIYISDGAASFYPADVIEASREACFDVCWQDKRRWPLLRNRMFLAARGFTGTSGRSLPGGTAPSLPGELVIGLPGARARPSGCNRPKPQRRACRRPPGCDLICRCGVRVLASLWSSGFVSLP